MRHRTTPFGPPQTTELRANRGPARPGNTDAARPRGRAAILIVAALFGSLVLSTSAAGAETTTGWRAPVVPLEVLRGFEAPDGPYGSGHRGIDLAAAIGSVVAAPADGVVSFVGSVGGTAIVVVRHGDLRSTFQPVAGSVPLGQPVHAGQPIGSVVVSPIHCARSCVHWGVLRGQDYLDPLALLGVSHPRLLPYWQLPPPLGHGEGDRAAAAYTPPPVRGTVDADADADDDGPVDRTTSEEGNTGGASDAHAPRPNAELPVPLAVSLSLATSGVVAWLVVVAMRRRPK